MHGEESASRQSLYYKTPLPPQRITPQYATYQMFPILFCGVKPSGGRSLKAMCTCGSVRVTHVHLWGVLCACCACSQEIFMGLSTQLIRWGATLTSWAYKRFLAIPLVGEIYASPDSNSIITDVYHKQPIERLEVKLASVVLGHWHAMKCWIHGQRAPICDQSFVLSLEHNEILFRVNLKLCARLSPLASPQK